MSRLHEDIQAKSCAACGSIFVPGINSKVKVVPVKETRIEKDRRKKLTRKQAKMELNKNKRGSNMVPDKDSAANGSATSIPTESSESIATEAVARKQTLSQREKKVIRITPYTELDRQQQQFQQQRRNTFGNKDQPLKVNKRANQILNHVIYSCQRCHRDTELPGTKEGYLTSRVKVTKPISRRRRLAKEQEHQQQAAKQVEAVAATIPAALGNSMSHKQGAAAHQGVKRKAPSQLAGASSDFGPPKHSVSMPSSPAGRLSTATSIASSAATSPTSSPRLQSFEERKGGGAGNKKKKKGGLASLLASQKSNGPSSSDPGSGAGGSGDSVLANFLMGL
ncbi:hypothetical protein BGZ70_000392 [Mortierella alpina]|uniref:Uncharacterized protein n=1 Tax=Mortierella alpina TaxID=64518 RepID=A0A9P6LYS6_MORAP|nr:hypothetical protein BGZ70_000392 [Mortierella alpina]